MVPHSSTLAWKIPWTEEPGRLQSMRSLWVRHNWATSLSLFIFMHWRRKWQPTPVLLPGESQGWWSLVGCRLWGSTESDMTEATQQQQQQHPSIPLANFFNLLLSNSNKVGEVWGPEDLKEEQTDIFDIIILINRLGHWEFQVLSNAQEIPEIQTVKSPRSQSSVDISLSTVYFPAYIHYNLNFQSTLCTISCIE